MIAQGPRVLFTAGISLIFVLVLLSVFPWSTFAQGISVAVKGGLLSEEISTFSEFFFSPHVAASLGVGVQSASFTLSVWTTVYVVRSTQTFAPYVGFGGKLLISGVRVPAFLMLMGGLRFNLPPIRALSMLTEFVVFVRVPAFNQVVPDARFGLALRF